MGIPELQEAIANLRIKFDTRMTSLEEQFGCYTTVLQEIKGMLIRMQYKDDDDEDEEFKVYHALQLGLRGSKAHDGRQPSYQG